MDIMELSPTVRLQLASMAFARWTDAYDCGTDTRIACIQITFTEGEGL